MTSQLRFSDTIPAGRDGDIGASLSQPEAQWPNRTRFALYEGATYALVVPGNTFGISFTAYFPVKGHEHRTIIGFPIVARTLGGGRINLYACGSTDPNEIDSASMVEVIPDGQSGGGGINSMIFKLPGANIKLPLMVAEGGPMGAVIKVGDTEIDQLDVYWRRQVGPQDALVRTMDDYRAHAADIVYGPAELVVPLRFMSKSKMDEIAAGYMMPRPDNEK